MPPCVVTTGPDVDDYRAGGPGVGHGAPRQRHTVAGVAEYVVVPADRISPAPAGVSAVAASSLVVAGSTR